VAEASRRKDLTVSFSSIFIQRPIATSLLMVALLLLGVIGYRALPVAALPDIDSPSLVVTTQYPGASASTMAALITTPLERQFGQISGITTMSSDSSAGLSTIIVEFDQKRDIDAAGQDVQSAINAARGTLPNNLPYPPVYNKVNPADAPILTLMLTSDSRPLRDVNDYADSIIAQRLSQIGGVGLVSIAGNVRPAVRVQVNPAQLAGLGPTMEDVRSSLTQANVNAPKGSLNGTVQSFSIGTNDQLSDAYDYRSTIISYKNDAAVRLSQRRYEAGYSAYLEVLIAQRALYEAQTGAVQNRQALMLASVDLMKALGGGWDPASAVATSPATRRSD
jgi:multidrug efflux pump